MYMKSRLVILILAGLMACSDQITVRTDYDHAINIADFKTFTWLSKEGIEERNNPLYYNELNDKRIHEAVLSELTTKGYVQDKDNPMLKVHYHIIIEDKAQVRNDTYSPYWIKTERDIYSYREGTLIVDLMDAKNESLLWRGWAISALSDQDQLSDEMIRKAVAKICAKLPPAIK